jgi:hypothetical protein
MKAKDFIIIGGAVALFLLWQKNKSKKLSVSTAETTSSENSSEPSGGTTSGGGFPKPSVATVSTEIPVRPVVRDLGNITPFNTSTQTPTFPAPTTNQPEQVYGLTLPTGMDLPVLTAGTGVPTEVAVQQGGVTTTPTPAIVPTPILTTQESLNLGGVRPVRDLSSSLTTNIKDLV